MARLRFSESVVPLQPNVRYVNTDVKSWEFYEHQRTPIMEYDVTRLLLYDAMTAPLIKPLQIESHTFVHHGSTSSGKTLDLIRELLYEGSK